MAGGVSALRRSQSAQGHSTEQPAFPRPVFDAETGLHYNWNRYYNPKTGRYITADPIGLAGGMNVYAYAGGNPVNAVDVEGLYRSPEMLRILVPGQILYDEGMTAFEDGQYALGTLYMGGMIGEQILSVLTLGEYSVLKNTGQCLIPRISQSSNYTWKFWAGKSPIKWSNQMQNRGWTHEQISEAIKYGKRYRATNLINKHHSATRYIHPKTGRSVVIDDITREVIHIVGDGYKY
ncbi:RHS repeat-associated core domain-containing protein [Desulfomicrobium orale]|uniref:RHS repeat-associated core domain-containing protein n=1 Tax=Desulfomicrobium orale TaxID=132132 RepID=UPI003AAB12CD